MGWAASPPPHTHLDGIQDVDGANDVVVLCEHGALAVNHGVGRGALLAEVDHGVRRKGGERIPEKLKVANVANCQLNVVAADFAPPARVIGSGQGC